MRKAHLGRRGEGGTKNSPERGSLSNVKQGLDQGKADLRQVSRALTPSLRNPLLRYNLSPTASSKSTVRSKIKWSVLLSDRGKVRMVFAHLQGILTIKSTLTSIKLVGVWSTPNSKSGQPQINSPISFATRRKAMSEIKRVRKPRSLERVR